MKFKMPPWLPSVLWGIGIIFTAFFMGKMIDVYLESRMAVPHEIILAKEEVKEVKQEKTISDYQRDIVPMFTGGKTVTDATPNPDKKKDGEEIPESPVNQVNWDQELSSGGGKIFLKGTIIGSDTAVAFIQVGDEDMSLHIGQKAGSYYIDRIEKSSVIFKKDNEEVFVSMDLGARVNTGRVAMPVRTIPPKPEENNEELDNIVADVGGKKVVDRVKFNALLTPPSRLANSIKFIPYAKDGKPYGIKISYLKGGSFFTKVGLQAGDVLVKSNNSEIMSVEDSFKVYQMFKNEDHMTLEVDRGGSNVKVPIEFR